LGFQRKMAAVGDIKQMLDQFPYREAVVQISPGSALRAQRVGRHPGYQSTTIPRPNDLFWLSTEASEAETTRAAKWRRPCRNSAFFEVLSPFGFGFCKRGCRPVPNVLPTDRRPRSFPSIWPLESSSTCLPGWRSTRCARGSDPGLFWVTASR